MKENEKILPTEREERIINVRYSEDSSCEVKFLKMIEPISKEKYDELKETEKANYCVETPLNTTRYFVDKEKKIVCLYDQPIKMRDGIIIYADIYVPSTALESPVPLIVNWSLLGKQVCKQEQAYKNLANPLYWCYQDYAVANVDPRGIGNSEGSQQQYGNQEGEDGYDFIEWATRQKWCNDRVGLFGNCINAMSHFKIAEKNPPHLCCIAPFGTIANQYRENILDGGIPKNNEKNMVNIAKGKGLIDDMMAMTEKEPFITSPYWQDKIPSYEQINIPTYIVCNWNSNKIKSSWNSFELINTDKKWIKCEQNKNIYNSKNILELKLFFDRYLKGIMNGWEETPKIRIDVMDAFDDKEKREETTWPLKQTEYRKLYLNANTKKLGDVPVKTDSEVSYDSEKEEINFDYTFRKDTELTGYMKLHLFVEAKDYDDMDIFATIKKLSSRDEELPIGNCYLGSLGKLRVSARNIDLEKSTEYKPFYTYDRIEKIKSGEIIPVDIEIEPISRIWHKGQKLRLSISGKNDNYQVNNKGEHIIHTGSEFESYLLIPEIAPKYEDGNYIYK